MISFAAVTDSEGYRHVFFQDRNRTLRQTTYTHSSLASDTATTYLDAKDVRNLTPLSATIQVFSDGSYNVVFPEPTSKYMTIDFEIDVSVLYPC